MGTFIESALAASENASRSLMTGRGDKEIAQILMLGALVEAVLAVAQELELLRRERQAE